MTPMKVKEVCSVLNLGAVAITRLVKQGVLKKVNPSDIHSLLDSNSVYEYKKELDERRNTNPAKWIYRNEF